MLDKILTKFKATLRKLTKEDCLLLCFSVLIVGLLFAVVLASLTVTGCNKSKTNTQTIELPKPTYSEADTQTDSIEKSVNIRETQIETMPMNDSAVQKDLSYCYEVCELRKKQNYYNYIYSVNPARLCESIESITEIDHGTIGDSLSQQTINTHTLNSASQQAQDTLNNVEVIDASFIMTEYTDNEGNVSNRLVIVSDAQLSCDTSSIYSKIHSDED